MNYYPFHLGDYATHAGHLDPVEDCAYRRLIDLYMLTEQALPLDVELLARKIRMRDHAAAVRDVLNEFFTQTDDAWTHSRCDREIAAFRRAADNASKAGKASALSRKATTVERPFNDCSTTVQPTKSQEPRAKSQEKERESATDAADAAPRSRAIAIPADFPGNAELAWCDAERPELSAATVAVAFRDYHLAHGSTMKSWPAAWRTWVRKERSPPSAAQRSTSAADRQAEAIYRITGGLAGKPSTDERVIDVESFRQRQLAGR
jgi:uncharacterized protein YdaU (DUF1376 family)